MNRILFGRCAAFLAFAALATAARAQTTCTGALTYTPQNPVFPQPITATFTAQSSAAPTSTQNGTYLLTFSASEPGVPVFAPAPDSGFEITTVPDAVSYTFTPFQPGAVTLRVGTQSMYSFGLTPLCGEFGPGATTVIQVAPTPVTQPTYDGLKGQYAFAFNGLNPQIQGASDRLAAVGSFTADGQGHITAGTEDVNSGAGSSTLVPISGSYTIDAAGNGALTLASSFGVQKLSFFVPKFEQTQLNNPVPQITGVQLFSTDGYVVFGGGSLQLQDVPTATPTELGAYALGLSGYLPCSSTCNGGASIYESGSLSFDTVAGGPHGTLSGSVGAVLLPSSPVGDTQFAGIDPVTGRFTFTLSQGQFPPLHFAGYAVDGLHLLLVSTDSHKTTYLLSGTAIQQ